MTKILHVDSSSRSATSVTRQLSKYLTEGLQKSHPGSAVKYRDLIEEHLPFASELGISALYTPAEHRTPDQKKAYAFVESQANDIVDSDIYVFGVPMYNFTVPAVFKAFIDLIVVPGKTFAYEAGVIKPMLKNKKAFVVTASGGSYDEPPMNGLDFVEPYLRAVLGFMGVTDVTFVKAAGHSDDEVRLAVEKAKKAIDDICAVKV
ncbi:MAG: NAD(P)H-dependent oxidoreductase [Cyanobacteria bacterium SZAS LIN-3]|nr:NAD(P)H-dependent oxidoreductase [Cyanobacteria bacterium SZAS LIN-3]